MNSNPLTTCVQGYKALRHPTMPPLAPDPGAYAICANLSFAISLIACSTHESSKSSWLMVAPFCGPNIKAAPVGPQSGFKTSHGIKIYSITGNYPRSRVYI